MTYPEPGPSPAGRFWNAYLFCRATGAGRLESLAMVLRWLVYP